MLAEQQNGATVNGVMQPTGWSGGQQTLLPLPQTSPGLQHPPLKLPQHVWFWSQQFPFGHDCLQQAAPGLLHWFMHIRYLA